MYFSLIIQVGSNLSLGPREGFVFIIHHTGACRQFFAIKKSRDPVVGPWKGNRNC